MISHAKRQGREIPGLFFWWQGSTLHPAGVGTPAPALPAPPVMGFALR